jgi:hypothetical protein
MNRAVSPANRIAVRSWFILSLTNAGREAGTAAIWVSGLLSARRRQGARRSDARDLDRTRPNDLLHVMDDPEKSERTETAPQPDTPAKKLTPAAERALAEAAARRADIDRKSAERPKELRGRGGLEPARYGDWEVKGIASDF